MKVYDESAEQANYGYGNAIQIGFCRSMLRAFLQRRNSLVRCYICIGNRLLLPNLRIKRGHSLPRANLRNHSRR